MIGEGERFAFFTRHRKEPVGRRTNECLTIVALGRRKVPAGAVCGCNGWMKTRHNADSSGKGVRLGFVVTGIKPACPDTDLPSPTDAHFDT